MRVEYWRNYCLLPIRVPGRAPLPHTMRATAAAVGHGAARGTWGAGGSHLHCEGHRRRRWAWGRSRVVGAWPWGGGGY